MPIVLQYHSQVRTIPLNIQYLIAVEIYIIVHTSNTLLKNPYERRILRSLQHSVSTQQQTLNKNLLNGFLFTFFMDK